MAESQQLSKNQKKKAREKVRHTDLYKERANETERGREREREREGGREGGREGESGREGGQSTRSISHSFAWVAMHSRLGVLASTWYLRHCMAWLWVGAQGAA